MAHDPYLDVGAQVREAAENTVVEVEGAVLAQEDLGHHGPRLGHHRAPRLAKNGAARRQPKAVQPGRDRALVGAERGGAGIGVGRRKPAADVERPDFDSGLAQYLPGQRKGRAEGVRLEALRAHMEGDAGLVAGRHDRAEELRHLLRRRSELARQIDGGASRRGRYPHLYREIAAAGLARDLVEFGQRIDGVVANTVLNQFGDLERCALRPGNVHSAHEWRDVLEPVVARYRDRLLRRYFRGDAAFALPGIYEFLEAEGFRYAIRLPANRVLQDSIGHLLKRPVGRPPKDVRRYYASFSYRAATWTKPRRVVAKVEWHPGELYPRVGFIVTNLSRRAERVVAFYNQRGTAEQHIKEGKNAIKWTRLSCRRFDHNAVRLQLHALAYNLGNFMRTLALPDAVEQWSLTSLREKLIKIGAKIVRHGRYVTFQMAEVAIPRDLFADILRRIDRLRPNPSPA